jgi:hypothetical protein
MGARFGSLKLRFGAFLYEHLNDSGLNVPDVFSREEFLRVGDEPKKKVWVVYRLDCGSEQAKAYLTKMSLQFFAYDDVIAAVNQIVGSAVTHYRSVKRALDLSRSDLDILLIDQSILGGLTSGREKDLTRNVSEAKSALEAELSVKIDRLRKLIEFGEESIGLIEKMACPRFLGQVDLDQPVLIDGKSCGFCKEAVCCSFGTGLSVDFFPKSKSE